MDVFIEKIVKKRKESKDSVLTGLIIIATLFVALIVLNLKFLSGFNLIIALGAIYGAYRLIKMRDLEFEYIVTNGELDIDKIIAKSKRKRVFTGKSKDFEIVAKVKSDKFSPEYKSIKNVIFTGSEANSDDLYFLVVNNEGKRTIVYFEPDDRMLDSFKTYNPRNVFK